MKKKLKFIIIYIIFFFNSNLLSQNDNRILKVGLLAPLTGNYSELGNSFLYSLQLALEEINDKNVSIVPRDSGFNDEDKLNKAIQDLRDQDIKIIIGPISHEELDNVKKYNDHIKSWSSNGRSPFRNARYT